MGKPSATKHSSMAVLRSQSVMAKEEVEHWMEQMGIKFCAVWFYTARRWVLEQQVDDHDTFLDTVDMALARLGGTYAMWRDGESWVLVKYSTGDTRTYPSREAAEMVAIHGG